jgi:hypothetical protein
MRLVALVVLSALVVGLVIGIAIGIDSSGFPPAGLEGTWVLRYYGEPGKLRMPYPWSEITLIISVCATAEQRIGGYPARTNVIAGSAGVNWYFGNYEVEGNKFITYTVAGEEKHIGNLVCTEMGGLHTSWHKKTDISISLPLLRLTKSRMAD